MPPGFTTIGAQRGFRGTSWIFHALVKMDTISQNNLSDLLHEIRTFLAPINVRFKVELWIVSAIFMNIRNFAQFG